MVWTDIPDTLEADFNEWYNREHLPELLKQRGILAAWYGERDAAALASATADIPRKTDRFLDSVIMVEGVDSDALDAAMPFLTWDRLAAHGGSPDSPAARLRVCNTVHANSNLSG